MKNMIDHSEHGEKTTAYIVPIKENEQGTALLEFFAVPAVPQGYFLRCMPPWLKRRY
ncbi:MAG: hypothetical protein H6R17_1732 [Proteobacteria bacterium]|nr:hypothetical protein [Pseudomonadota bacterium]